MNSIHSKIILIIAGTVVVSLALVFFATRPILAEISSVRIDMASSEAELAVINANIASYEEAAKALASVADDLQSIRQIFPPREEMVLLVEGLEASVEKSAASSKLTITDKMEPSFAKASEGRGSPPLINGLSRIEEVPYTLELSSGYKGLTDFLLYTENLPFMTEVAKLTVRAESFSDEASKTLRNTGEATSKIEGVFFIKSQ